MSRYVIGIDPGVSGAVVVLNVFSSGVPTMFNYIRMPTMKVGKSSRVNGAALAEFLRDFDCGTAVIERVQAMPGQGVSSMFTFGHSAGVIEGVLAGLAIPYTLTAPQVWKKRAGLIGTDKDAARSRAIQLWPRWSALAKKGEGQALADAALIAMFGEGRE